MPDEKKVWVTLKHSVGPRGGPLYGPGKVQVPESFAKLIGVEPESAPGDEESDVDATDAAAELAADHGIDLATITGTGKDGRITVADVEAAIAAQDNA